MFSSFHYEMHDTHFIKQHKNNGKRQMASLLSRISNLGIGSSFLGKVEKLVLIKISSKIRLSNNNIKQNSIVTSRLSSAGRAHGF